MRTRRVAATMAVAPAMAVAILVAGCAGGSSGRTYGGAGGTTTRSATAATSMAMSMRVNGHGTRDVRHASAVTIAMGDDFFSPSVLVGRPGQRLRVTLANRSGTDHNFTLAAQHVNTDVAAGATATATVTFPASGVRAFWCEYHRSLGMAGRLRSS